MAEQQNNKKESVDLKTLVLGCLAGAGLIFGLCGFLETRRMARVFNEGVDKVRNLTSVDVSHTIVEEAVKKAADKETARAVNQIINRSRDMMQLEISQKVQTAVHEQYGALGKAVKEALTKKASEIDIFQLREEVIEKAKEQIAEQFEGKLDSLLDDYNQNLANVGKIYQSIANSMGAEKTKAGVTLNVG